MAHMCELGFVFNRNRRLFASLYNEAIACRPVGKETAPVNQPGRKIWADRMKSVQSAAHIGGLGQGHIRVSAQARPVSMHIIIVLIR